MFAAARLKNCPLTVSFIRCATLVNAVSAGTPSPSLFPSWNSADENSFSSFFVFSLILITCLLLIL